METKNTLSYSLAEETFESENAFGTCCDIGQTCIGKDVKMTYFLE